jgi:hypothetical protein
LSDTGQELERAGVPVLFLGSLFERTEIKDLVAVLKRSATYRNAASLPHAGELGEGGSVEVKKQGTIFNVTRTVQS